METTDAILLRKTKLTETSLIITWFSEGHGKIKTVAKGARRPISRFAGVLDLFYHSQIHFSRSRRSDLHILQEVVLENAFAGLRQRYETVLLCSYFTELLELVTESEHAAPELFDLLKRAFTHLDAKLPTMRVLLHFEAELTRLLGVADRRESSPAMALGRIYGRLPAGRKNLLDELARKRP